jgi:hypothetical protein
MFLALCPSTAANAAPAAPPWRAFQLP